MLPIWTFHFIFLFFEILKNKNRKSKIRQVLFLFHLLIAFDDTSIPTEYNIPELQIKFDEILTVVGHNSGQNRDYHFPVELNLPWAQGNCRTEETTYSSEYEAEISLSANHVSPRILSLQKEKWTVNSEQWTVNNEQTQTCLPFLVHRTTGGCTYIITFLLVSCISEQKLYLGKKIHRSKPANKSYHLTPLQWQEGSKIQGSQYDTMLRSLYKPW